LELITNEWQNIDYKTYMVVKNNFKIDNSQENENNNNQMYQEIDDEQILDKSKSEEDQ
ncbi:6533_t:CDS:1, partial [Racocetra persica]